MTIDCTVVIPTHFWDIDLENRVKTILRAGCVVRVVCDGFQPPNGNFGENLYFYSTKNKVGPNIARNLALVNITTEWTLFLDSDDLLNLSGLKKLVAHLNMCEIKHVQVISCCIEFKDHLETKTVFEKNAIELRGINNPFESICLGKLPAVCWGRLYKSDIFSDTKYYFPSSRKHGRDILFSRKLALDVEYWFKANFTLVTSRKRPQSFSRKFSETNVKSALSLTRTKISPQSNDCIENSGNIRHLKYILILCGFRMKSYKEFLRSLKLVNRGVNNLPQLDWATVSKSASSYLLIKVLSICPRMTWMIFLVARKVYVPY